MNSETLSLRTIINELDLLKKKCYYSVKSLKNKIFVVAFNLINKKKISDPRDAKEHYQSFIRKKITNLAKQSKIISY